MIIEHLKEHLQQCVSVISSGVQQIVLDEVTDE